MNDQKTLSTDRPVGLTRDAGWQIGVSRTLPVPVADVWGFLASPAGFDLWLDPGARPVPQVGAEFKTATGRGEVRSWHELDRIRIRWIASEDDGPDTTIQVAIASAATGTTIRFHEERLSDEAARLRRRAHWQRVAEAICDELAPQDGGAL